MFILCFALGICVLAYFVVEKILEEGIKFEFHPHFSSAGETRGGNKKFNSLIFLLFCFSFSQEPNGGKF